jgi:hypothetical protein
MIRDWKKLKEAGLAKVSLVQHVGKDSKGRLIGAAYSLKAEFTHQLRREGDGAQQEIPLDEAGLGAKITEIEAELADSKALLADMQAVAATYVPPKLDGLNEKGERLDEIEAREALLSKL